MLRRYLSIFVAAGMVGPMVKGLEHPEHLFEEHCSQVHSKSWETSRLQVRSMVESAGNCCCGATTFFYKSAARDSPCEGPQISREDTCCCG